MTNEVDSLSAVPSSVRHHTPLQARATDRLVSLNIVCVWVDSDDNC
jgi:hypothetical protein